MNPYERLDTVQLCLNAHRVDDLKKLAQQVDTGRLPTRKDDLIGIVRAHLTGSELKALWTRLGKLDQAAVAEAVHDPNGLLYGESFRAKYGDEARGSLLGFFFLDQTRIPADLRKRLASFVPKPAPDLVAAIESLPETVEEEQYRYEGREKVECVLQVPIESREMEQTAQREVLAVLRLVDAGKVAVSEATRWPTAAGVRAVSALLDGGDFYADTPDVKTKKKADKDDGDGDVWEPDEDPGPIRAFAWPLLLQAGGLAVRSGKRLALSKSGRAALSAPPCNTLRLLWAKWFDSKLLDELRRIEHIRGQTGNGKRELTALSGRRNAIYGALSKCPVGKWVALDEFSRYMRAESAFEVTHDPWTLYFLEAQYGALGYQGHGGWNILQFRYLLAVLFEYAATLGVIDVAYRQPVGARPDYHGCWGVDGFAFLSRYDGLWFLRLNALGAYCLGLCDSYTPTPVERRKILNVLPNLDVVAVEDLGRADVLWLERFATRSAERVWKLDRDLLVSALASGRALNELREFLTANGQAPLPDLVEQLFQDIERRASAVRDLGAARLIECADAATAALIASDSVLKKHCSRAGDSTIVVPVASVRAFQRGLRRLGYAIQLNTTD